MMHRARILLFLLALPTGLLGQSGPGFSFDPDDQTQTGAGLDAINSQNGILSLAIPVGPAYAVGPGLSFQARLFYSSRVWAPGVWQIFGSTPEPNMLLDGNPALGLGWRFSLGQIVESAAGVPSAYLSPEGGAHRLYSKRFFNGASDGFWYTRDGSYLRVKYLGVSSGYQLWTPDGTFTTFAQHVQGYDNTPANYVSDYGRGRDGWHATRIENSYGDAITATYQATGTSSPCGPPTQNCWVPYQITIPSLNSTPATRTITVNMSGGVRVTSISVPAVGGATATYTLTHAQHGSALTRPYPHPTTTATAPYYLDRIDLPIAGYSYSFAYNDASLAVSYANGTMASQTIPTGARVNYTYGTWTWYHANPLNRPTNCGYPLVSYPTGRPILKTGPGTEPFLTHPGTDCGAADRAAGIVQRVLTYSTLSAGTATATTKFYEYDYPNGESGTDTAAQTQTLVLSPVDGVGKQHSTTHLFTASTDKAISGPFVGALLRTAVYANDQSSGATSVPSTTSALRVRRYTYGADAYDTNPTNPGAEAFEANRRVTQDLTLYSGVDPNHAPGGGDKYHQVDYVFDATAGRYTKETHSGTIGGALASDARQTETIWTPLVDASHWKLDLPQTRYLRATAGGANFSTVATTFDSAGFPTADTTTDGNGYGSFQHTTPRDARGIPNSQVFTHGSSTYTQTLSFAAGSLASLRWSPLTWNTLANQVDPATGLVTMSTDPAGLSTAYTYDVLGRPRVTTPPGADAGTTITYVSPTVTTSRTADSNNIEHAWIEATIDSLGRPVKTRRALAGLIAKLITRYDPQGNTVFVSEWLTDAAPDNTTTGTTTSFDHFGRSTAITRADQKSTTIGYADGAYPNSIWLQTITVGDVGGAPAVTKNFLDAFGNIVKVSEPTGDDTTYTYDAADHLRQVTQGAQTRIFTYDAFGLLRSETRPEKNNQPVTYASYDALGNVLSETQPGGLTITRTYDAAGRLTGVLANSQRYLTNCYDGAGACVDGTQNFPGGNYPIGKLTRSTGYNPGTTSGATITQDFTFSGMAGRLSARSTSSSVSGFTPVVETWAYDPGGAVVQYNHPRRNGLFAVATTYDHGLPTSVRANGLPVVLSTAYAPTGLLAAYVTGNSAGTSVTTNVAADPNGLPRPGRIVTSGASQNLDTGTYAYDGAGNITQMGTDTFSYDKLSRLTAAVFGSSRQDFTYDRYGNLTSTTGINPRTFSVSASTNRLTAAGYDARGNLLSIGNETCTYDGLDRLARYQTTAGVDWQYLYTADSERSLKIPPSGAPADYVWTLRDTTKQIATEYVGPSLSRDNVYLGNLLVASYATCGLNGPPGWSYYSADHLSTPRLITDASGNAVDVRKYWPYGDVATVTQPNSPTRVQFAGLERDTEGAGTRFYDHARSYEFQSGGRFLSVDLAPGAEGNPQTWNGYSYVRGNPITATDPTGLEAENIGSEFTGFDPASGRTIAGRFTGLAGSPADFGTAHSGTFDSGRYWDTEGWVWTQEKYYIPDIGIYLRNESFASKLLFLAVEPYLQILGAGRDLGQLGKGLAGIALLAAPIKIPGLSKAAQLVANRAAGLAAEDAFAKALIDAGYDVVGRHISLRGPEGGRRVADIIVRIGEEFHAIEVKTGNAVRTSSQVAADAAINRLTARAVGRKATQAGITDVLSTTTVWWTP